MKSKGAFAIFLAGASSLNLLSSCGAKTEPVPAERSATTLQSSAPSPNSAFDWEDLESLGKPDGDDSHLYIRIHLPQAIQDVNTPISDLYCSVKDMNDEDYMAYMGSISEAYAALPWRQEPRQAAQTTRITFAWSDIRRSDDGTAIGLEQQGGSFYSPRSGEYSRIDVSFQVALLPGETIDDIDVRYFSDFLTSVLGKEIDPSLLLSIVKYGEENMVTAEDGLPARNISVYFSDPIDSDNDVSLETMFFRDADGTFHAGVSAIRHIRWGN